MLSSVPSIFAILLATLLCGGFGWRVWRDSSPNGRAFQRARSPRQAVQIRNVILGSFGILWAINVMSVIRHHFG